MDEYGEEDFLSVDIANRWVALAFNTWDENGIAHIYQPINQKYEDSQEDAPVNIGSQTPVLKRNALDNLDLAAECVLHFAKTGELYPNLKWEKGLFAYVISCGRLYRRNLFDGISFPEGRLNEDAFVYYLSLIHI